MALRSSWSLGPPQRTRILTEYRVVDELVLVFLERTDGVGEVGNTTTNDENLIGVRSATGD
jgi:hypothetical protein